MKFLVTRIFPMLCAFFPALLFSQILSSNGATMVITSGGIVMSNGGVSLTNNTILTNNGDLRITKNSSISQPGTFQIASASAVDGNGNYIIEQDWINDALFSAENSSVNLYGNTEQFITSTNGTVTEFHNLTLSGSGTGVNRKKTLQGVDARIDLTGKLTINNRECATQTNDLVVLNTSNDAISNSQAFGTEGFVSSEEPGYLNWATNSTNSYYFPVGSSSGTTRYRPVTIRPNSIDYNEFNVRMNNSSGNNYGYFLDQHDQEIDELNALYFHSIEQNSGIDNVDLSISYLPSADGDWFSIGHWSSSESLWNSVGETAVQTMGNYSSVQKSNWIFADPDHPYVLVNSPEELIIPNVFTPNGDGTNDGYFVTSKGIIEFNIVIVNRWGNTVFESNDVNNSWDGTSNGNLCDDGVYFYLIKAKSKTKEYNKQGHITLHSN